MKTWKLKDLYKGLGTSSLLFDSFLTPFYPDIEGNESNFLTDYATSHAVFDKAFTHKFGERVIDLESDTLSDAITEFRGITSGVTMLNLSNWARLYYALSLDYNPLYNVDGLTTYTHGATSETYTFGKDKTTSQYGATQDTVQYGATEDTTEYGATSKTEGAHLDTDTDYVMSYDSATEKEAGKQTHDNAAKTTTELLHTDTQSSIQHSDISSSLQHTDTSERDARSDGKTTTQYIDTELRQGNIGVTKSTELLKDTYALYTETKGFWDTIFKILANEGGLYYDNSFV